MSPCRDTVRSSALFAALLLGYTGSAAEPPASKPATVRDVQYSGAEHLSESELRKLTGVRPGDSTSPLRNEEGRQAILRKYQEDGRFYTTVELTKGRSASDTSVVYEIVEGPIVKVAEIQFSGNKNIAAEKLLAAKRASGVVTGKALRPDAIEADLKTLGGYYRECGFRGTNVLPEVIRSSDMSKVTIVYHVCETK